MNPFLTSSIDHAVDGDGPKECPELLASDLARIEQHIIALSKHLGL